MNASTNLKARFYHPLTVFVLYAVLTLVLYYPTRYAGFTSDFTGWQENFETQGVAGIPRAFDYHGLHHVFLAIYYTLYRLFHIRGIPWYLLFALFHALNAALMYRLFRHLFARLEIPSGRQVALMGTLFFLVNPFQAEVLVWKTCLHYLMALFFLLTVLWEEVRYLESGQVRHLYIAHLVFFVSLFSLELSYVTPLFSLALVLFVHSTYVAKALRQSLVRVVAPQFVLLALFFGLNKLVLGEIVGHYGTERHLLLKPTDFLAGIYRYTLKYVTFGRFWDFHKEMKMYDFVSQPVFVWPVTALLVVLFVRFLLTWQQRKARTQVAWFLAAGWVIGLLPVANLFFTVLLLGNNDRYGYYASGFLLTLFALGLYGIRYRPLRNALLSAWLITNVVLQQRLAYIWRVNGVLHDELLANFDFPPDENILILSLPDDNNGLLLFRMYSSTGVLVDDLRYHSGKVHRGEIRAVAMYNVMDLGDGVQVIARDSTTLEVFFKQWGNWWWMETLGAPRQMENDLFKFKLIPGGYRLTFKRPPDEYTLIYQDGLEWQVVPWPPTGKYLDAAR